MLKPFLFLPLFFLYAIAGEAQFDTGFARKNITRCADSLVRGFRTKNWELFSLYSNPAIIGTMGGKAAFIQFVSQTFSTIPASAWKSYKPGNVLQVVKTPYDLQSVIELISVVEWEGKRVSSTAALVGQSWDGGLNWTFFDSQNDSNAVKMIKPDISPEIKIPAKNEKVERLDAGGKPVPAKPPAGKKAPAARKNG